MNVPGAASTLSAVSTNVTTHAQKLTLSQSGPAASRCFHAATSTATAKMAVASSNGSGSGADEIRCKLLYKLGIYDDGNKNSSSSSGKAAPSAAGAARSCSGRRAVRRVRQWTPPRVLPSSSDVATSSSSEPSTSSSKVLLGNAVPFSIPLKQNKDNNDNKDDTHIKTADNDAPQEESNNKSKRSNKSKIAFDTKVSVVPIPLHSDYSRRLRTRLWSGRHEIRHNAARNAVEFAAEGWDWRTVTEDEQMFVCAVSGQLVHPVHCRYSRGNRRFASTAGAGIGANQAYQGGKLRYASLSTSLPTTTHGTNQYPHYPTRIMAQQQQYRQQQQQLLQHQNQPFTS